MKNSAFIYLIVFLSLSVISCKKEVYSPIVGIWEYLGKSSSRDIIPNEISTPLEIMEFTEDSLFVYDNVVGDFNKGITKPTARQKVKFIENYTDDNGVYHPKAFYIETHSTYPDRPDLYFYTYYAYEIKDDLLILDILNLLLMDPRSAFYRAYISSK